jgi:hypothetical protein
VKGGKVGRSGSRKVKGLKVGRCKRYDVLGGTEVPPSSRYAGLWRDKGGGACWREGLKVGRSGSGKVRESESERWESGKVGR